MKAKAKRFNATENQQRANENEEKNLQINLQRNKKLLIFAVPNKKGRRSATQKAKIEKVKSVKSPGQIGEII
ncbi:hypothetical protein [Desertivirga brevis]|uniref:hypothetical protein n=1 Tax=Desertivirga brevis TaxID=2810310 RepID=UPI001A97C17E|nr:hypothetical protein [Pedobacter sp. SYSU D00873]